MSTFYEVQIQQHSERYGPRLADRWMGSADSAEDAVRIAREGYDTRAPNWSKTHNPTPVFVVTGTFDGVDTWSYTEDRIES